MIGILFIIAFLVVLAFVLLITRQEGDFATSERAHMPEEIATGRLVLSEVLLRTAQPAMLVAKPDQVYLTRAGYLVPVENKTRRAARVYDSDVIELSVQACVLRHAGVPGHEGRPVANYGYVAIRRPGRPPVFRRTQLLDDHQVISLRARRLAIESGREAPRGPAHPKVCEGCGHRQVCPQMGPDRS